MKYLQIIGLAVGTAMMAWGGVAQQTQNFGVQDKKLDSALDKLMVVVGEQIDTPTRTFSETTTQRLLVDTLI